MTLDLATILQAGGAGVPLTIYANILSTLVLIVGVLVFCWRTKPARYLALILLVESLLVMSFQLPAVLTKPYDSPTALWLAVYIIAGVSALFVRGSHAFIFAGFYAVAAIIALSDIFIEMTHGTLTGGLMFISYGQILAILYARLSDVKGRVSEH